MTDESATLIDNIFYNNYVQNSRSLAGILYTDISDHFPVYHIDYSDDAPLVDNSFKKRIYSMTTMERFSHVMNERTGTVSYIAMMHRMIILHFIMNYLVSIILAFLLRYSSEVMPH